MASELTIAEIITENKTATKVDIRVVINNPSNLEITGIEIDDMNITMTLNAYQDGKTYLNITATPVRYYDNYKLSSIKYKLNGENKQENVAVKVDTQFFKDISSYEDWQAMDEYPQNYKLIGDIDLLGKTDIKANVSINRLEAEIPRAIKNININFTNGGNGLIKEIKSSVKNINFENIKITSTVAYSPSGTGLIVTNSAYIEDVNFKNITIYAPNVTGVAMILGVTTNNKINNVTLEDITCTGSAYVGGLGGNITSTGINFSNIYANNLTITATGDYVAANYAGGITAIGPNTIGNNLKVENSRITGANNVGAIAGYGGGLNWEGNNNVINGVSGVGGLTGSGGPR